MAARPDFSDMLLRPTKGVAAAANAFLRTLGLVLQVQLSAHVAWHTALSENPDVPRLWDRYRAMSEPLRRAFRDGWPSFMAWLPAEARAEAASVASLLAEPDGAEFLEGLIACGPWNYEALSRMTGVELEIEHRRRRTIRRTARRRVGAQRGVDGAPARPSAPPPDPSSTELPAHPQSDEAGAVQAPPRAEAARPAAGDGPVPDPDDAPGATLTFAELTSALIEAGETNRGGEEVTLHAVRNRVRRAVGKRGPYAALAGLQSAKTGLFPRAAALREVERLAIRNRREHQDSVRSYREIRRTKGELAKGLVDSPSRPAED